MADESNTNVAPQSDEDAIDVALGLNDKGQPVPAKLFDDELGEPVKPPVKPEPDVAQAPPQEPDRLAAALRTIDEQNARLAAMEQRLSASAPRGVDRPEPMVDTIEVFPGRHIPKDPTKRLIRVTPEDLIRLGWNDEARGPAEVITTLANAFYGYVLDTIPGVTSFQLDQRNGARDQATAARNAFWGEFEDLRAHEAFVSSVEQQALSTGYLRTQGKTQEEYGRELGKLVREKVAAMRGISYDQYLAGVGRPSTPPRGTSRAVSPAGGGGPSARGANRDATFQQKVMDDTY